MPDPRRPTAFSLGEKTAIEEDEAFVSADGVVITPTAEIPDEVPAVVEAQRREGRTLATLFWAALGGLVSLTAGLAVTNLIDALFARAAWLGWLALAFGIAFLVAALGLAFREFRAVWRLKHIDAMRAEALDIIAKDDRARAQRLVGELLGLYAAEPRTARARQELARLKREIMDGSDLVRLAERELMTELDARARRIVGDAAKRVSLITAIAPRAIVDIAVVATVAVSLIRRVAEVYGGRPGRLGFFRLIRHVGAHLAVTGGMAAGEGFIDQLVGHGIAARVSAKLGEGMINGLLTARVGLAAIAVCRPLPFIELPQPTARDVAGSLFDREPSARPTAFGPGS